MKKKMSETPDYYVVNGSTNERVDLTGMTPRVLLWLLGRAKQDKKEKQKFVVTGLVVRVMNDTVYKFQIKFQFTSMLITHALLNFHINFMLQLEWLGKKNRGEWVPHRAIDELSQSLGPEHSGRLRGYPMYVNQSIVYGDPESRRPTHSDCVPRSQVRFIIILSSELGQTTLKYLQS